MMPMIKPEEEIRFTAKTGFLTKEIWNDFFAEGGERWRRKQWRFLARRGFFCIHPSKRASEVLVLNTKNKDVIAMVGDDISAPPFIAQIDHDELVARALLQFLKANTIANYQLESELKRLYPLVRNRRSRDEKEKYPDALIRLTNGLHIALEMELTLKSRRRYRHILRTYRTRQDADRIIFIVRSVNIFESISQAIQDTYYPIHERPIGFAWLDEWTSDPLKARIDFRSFSTSWREMAVVESASKSSANVPARNS